MISDIKNTWHFTALEHWNCISPSLIACVHVEDWRPNEIHYWLHRGHAQYDDYPHLGLLDYHCFIFLLWSLKHLHPGIVHRVVVLGAGCRCRKTSHRVSMWVASLTTRRSAGSGRLWLSPSNRNFGLTFAICWITFATRVLWDSPRFFGQRRRVDRHIDLEMFNPNYQRGRNQRILGGSVSSLNCAAHGLCLRVLTL